jgi:hypothetical protein
MRIVLWLMCSVRLSINIYKTILKMLRNTEEPVLDV